MLPLFRNLQMFQLGYWRWKLLALNRLEPIIRWQPQEGSRHAHRRRDTEALCGLVLVIRQAAEREWLDETCAPCRRAAWKLVNPAIPYPGDQLREEKADCGEDPAAHRFAKRVAAAEKSEGLTSQLNGSR